MISNLIMDPMNKGVVGGEIMGVIKFDPNTFEIKKTKIGDIDHHQSFGYTLLAKIEGIYQPTEFHKSYDLTDSFIKHNKKETLVSTKDNPKFVQANVLSSAGSIPKVGVFTDPKKSVSSKPSIEAVLEKAKELNVSIEDTVSYLEEIGYTAEDIAKSVPSKDKVMLQIENIKKKRKGQDPNKIAETVLAYLRGTKLYEQSSDTERENLEREINKDLNIKIKKAPSANKILGVKPNGTKGVNTQSKNFWRSWNKAYRESKRDQNNKRASLIKDINTIIDKSRDDATIKAKKLKAIQRRINSANLDNPIIVQRLLNYIEKTIEDVSHIAKIAEANSNLKTIRKNIKNKDKNTHIREAARYFLNVDPRLVDDIDAYLDISRKIVEGLKSTVINDKKTNVSTKFSISEVNDYTDQALIDQYVVIEDNKVEDVSEKSNDEKIQKVFDIHVAFVKEMKNQSDLIKELMKVDILDRPKKEAIKIIDALGIYIVNESTAGVGAIINKEKGRVNNKNTKVKTRPLKLYFSTRVGRLFAEQFTSMPIVFERIFGQKNARVISDKSGLQGVINGKARAIKQSANILENYTKKFDKVKGFNNQFNIFERGMIAFMGRALSKTDKTEFARRKGLIEESIKALSQGNKDEIKLAEAYQVVYDKILDKSENINDVKNKSQGTNVEAVDWWIGEWSKHYEDLRKVNEDVYNEILDNDFNYIPDIFKTLDVGEDFDASQSSFFNASNYVDKSKSGTLVKANRPSKLPRNKKDRPSRYISLSFDINNANTIQAALIDINTADSVMQVDGFINGDNVIIKNKEDRDLFERRIKDYIRASKGKGNYDKSELETISKFTNTLATIGVARALGGVTQSVKQTIPVAMNTLINSGRFDFSIIFDAGARDFINNSGMGIANRGFASTSSLDYLDKLLEEAANSKGEKLMKVMDKVNKFYLEMFLQKPDVFVARASFISYYKQDMKRRGKKIENWKDHKPDQQSLNYAQQQVDRQQNTSDSDLQGNFFNSSDPLKSIVRKVVFPFANFSMNQKARMHSDAITLFSKGQSTEDRKAAARSLAGLSVESLMFHSISVGIRYLLFQATLNMFDYEEEEKDKEKRIKAQTKGVATSIAKDIVSPLPVVDEYFVVGLNKVMTLLQDSEDPFTLYEENNKGLFDDLGVLGIGLTKIDKLYDKFELAETGEYKNFYGVKKEIRKDNKMKTAAALSLMYNLGVLPSEFETISNNIEKLEKKTSRDKSIKKDLIIFF